MNSPGPTSPVTGLRDWLRERVAHYAERDPGSIDPAARLTAYGLDSVYALILCGDREDHTGIVLEPTVVWDHPTIDGLAAHIEGLAARTGSPGDAR